MDVQMPGGDGLEATLSIRAAEADGPRTPIIALTADALSEDPTPAWARAWTAFSPSRSTASASPGCWRDCRAPRSRRSKEHLLGRRR
jgi:CheY-like chemotaxis protein